jgi:hypothetical protein
MRKYVTTVLFLTLPFATVCFANPYTNNIPSYMSGSDFKVNNQYYKLDPKMGLSLWAEVLNNSLYEISKNAIVEDLSVTADASISSNLTVGGSVGVGEDLSIGGTMTNGIVLWGLLTNNPTVTAGTGLSGGGVLTNDITVSIAGTAVTPGTYGAASNAITVDVNQQGQITSIGDSDIAIDMGQIVSGHPTVTAGTGLSGGGTLTGDITINISDTAVTIGEYGSPSESATFTVDQQGRIISATEQNISIGASQISSGTLPVSRGGTGAGSLSDGEVLLGAGTSAVTTTSRSGVDTRADFPTAGISTAIDVLVAGGTTNTLTFTDGRLTSVE